MADVLMLSVSGCRGTIGGSLTPEVAQRFAGAFAGWLKEGKKGKGPVTVALGRDGRRGSDLFAGLARGALLAAGCDVLDLDIAMTPTVGVVVDRQGLDGGLVITASHNPQNWCGLKPIVRKPGSRAGKTDASAPGKGTADALIAKFAGSPVPAPTDWRALGHARAESELGRVHAMVVRDALGSAAKKLAGSRARVVVDNLGMSGSAMSDWALREWLAPKADVRQMYEASSDLERASERGIFPHTPEPTRENLVGLCKAVKKAGAHVGFAQDPDADRLAVIDEKGRYIGEEYTLVLAALALGELGGLRRGGTIVVNLSTSRMIEDVAAGLGCRVVRSAVGEANVVEAMKAHRSPLGGEGNGGVIWPEVTYIRDSLGAMALVMTLMARRRQTISEILAGVPRYAIEKRKVELADRGRAVEAGEKIARAYSAQRVDRQDGVRVDFASRRAWLHVRASNTEPIMRLIAEAPTAAEATGLLDDAARVIG